MHIILKFSFLKKIYLNKIVKMNVKNRELEVNAFKKVST
jgi:hypothetical protein